VTIPSWTCESCGRSPADVDELLHWPVQTEGGTLCPECHAPAEVIVRGGGLPQGGGFDPETGGFERLPEGF
jgi:hypothetical protein